MRKFIHLTVAVAICWHITVLHAGAWSNGPSGNTTTNTPSECTNPPYGTHDWIADHALSMLPDKEKAWLQEYKVYYLLGTEAPDNNKIPKECGVPNQGYDDRNKGHSVEWSDDWSKMLNDRAAVRAKEEYDKAVNAYNSEDYKAAAFYLGAMAHYVGDVSAYPHSVPYEKFHSKYESWVNKDTDAFDAGKYESYLKLDKLVTRKPYEAVKRISKVTAGGKGKILYPVKMEELFDEDKDSEMLAESVGLSLNLGVNELADVLHTFYLNEVSE